MENEDRQHIQDGLVDVAQACADERREREERYDAHKAAVLARGEAMIARAYLTPRTVAERVVAAAQRWAQRTNDASRALVLLEALEDLDDANIRAMRDAGEL